MLKYEKLFESSEEDYDPFAPTIDKKWNWLSLVDRLSNGDITKHSEIYDLNLIQVFNLLGFWKVKDTYIEQMNKRKK